MASRRVPYTSPLPVDEGRGDSWGSGSWKNWLWIVVAVALFLPRSRAGLSAEPGTPTVPPVERDVPMLAPAINWHHACGSSLRPWRLVWCVRSSVESGRPYRHAIPDARPKKFGGEYLQSTVPLTTASDFEVPASPSGPWFEERPASVDAGFWFPMLYSLLFTSKVHVRQGRPKAASQSPRLVEGRRPFECSSYKPVFREDCSEPVGDSQTIEFRFATDQN